METENTIDSMGCEWAENDGRENKKPRPCRKISQDSLPPLILDCRVFC